MKHAIVFTLILLGSTLSAQTIQFKGHTIGETAEQFFSTATIMESGHEPTVAYCAKVLSKQKKRPAIETEGCQSVMAALQGMDAKVGNRYAYALGIGSTRFHAGKLVYMQFTMTTLDTPYSDVVVDMTKKLNTAPQESHVTYQNGFGATFQCRKAAWVSGNLIASVEETNPYRGEALQLIVTAMDAVGMNATSQQREATRPNTLDAVPTQPEKLATSTQVAALQANSEAAKTSPAAAAAMATDGKQLNPQEQADLVKQGLASRCAIVTSPVGAEVFIDGNRAGISPLALVLIRRDHPRVITIKMSGYKTVEKKVVPDGKTIPIGLTMEKQ